MENNYVKDVKHFGIGGILCISLLQMSMMGLSVILQDIAEAFPYISQTGVQFLATLPDFFIMVTVLLCGRLLIYVDKKNILIFSCCLFGICGIGGYLYHPTFFSLILWSSILGIAIGSMMPSVIAFIDDNYVGEQKDNILGYQNSAIGFGGLWITLTASFLALYHWYCMYLLYLWGFLCLFPILKIPKQPNEIKQVQVNKIKKKDWQWTLFYSSIVLVFFSLYNAISTNISMYLSMIGKQSNFYTSFVIGMLLIGSLFSGLCYGKLANTIKHTRILIGFSLLVIGLLVMMSSQKFIMILIGAFIAGSSLSIVMASATSYLSEKTASQMTIAIMLACSDLGGFLSFLFARIAELFSLNTQNNGTFCVLIIVSFFVFIVMLMIFIRWRKKGIEI